jgi:hypothetical protein
MLDPAPRDQTPIITILLALIVVLAGGIIVLLFTAMQVSSEDSPDPKTTCVSTRYAKCIELNSSPRECWEVTNLLCQMRVDALKLTPKKEEQ